MRTRFKGLSLEEQQELVRQGRVALETFGLGQFRNVSSIDNYGWNARFDGQASGFRYALNATAAIAQREEPGVASVPLTVSPKVFGNAHVSYALPAGWPTVAFASTVFGPRPVDRAYDAGWTTGTRVGTQLDLRLTLTGPVPKIRGLSYRAQATYSARDKGPYVVGPNQFIEASTPVPNLLPLDTFRTAVGLSYDLDL